MHRTGKNQGQVTALSCRADKEMRMYNLELTILEQEVEHEEDSQSLQEDLDLMVGRGMNSTK